MSFGGGGVGSRQTNAQTRGALIAPPKKKRMFEEKKKRKPLSAESSSTRSLTLGRNSIGEQEKLWWLHSRVKTRKRMANKKKKAVGFSKRNAAQTPKG